MFAQNKKIAILDSSRYYPKGQNPDILILRQSPKVNLDRVFENCKPKLVIADASNYRSYVSLWEATCRKQKIPFHNTYEKGFYQLKN
jgi:competence protein ComEC